MTTYWNWKGERKEIHSGLLKILMWIFVIVLVLIALIIQPFFWLVGCQGPFHDTECSLDREMFRRKANL